MQAMDVATQGQRWRGAVERSNGLLENHDRRHIAAHCKPSDYTALLDKLQHGELQLQKSHLAMMTPAFNRLQQYLEAAAEILPSTVECNLLWGYINLSIELELAAENDIALSSSKNSLVLYGALPRVAATIKTIGHKMELLIEQSGLSIRLEQQQEAALDVIIALLDFLTSSIRFFRNQGGTGFVETEQWTTFEVESKNAIGIIDQAFERIQKLSELARDVRERTQLSQLMSLQTLLSSEPARLPCVSLPPAKNSRFFDRDDIIGRIDLHLQGERDEPGVRSLALYGLGGVGKSHVALKYAHTRAEHFSAVLWIHSETAVAIAQSFTDIAISLKLPQADRTKSEENRLLVLEWLQRTKHDWLLIYDNAEDTSLLLRYWPVSNHGAIIVTSRNLCMSFEPAETGMEVTSFDPGEGSDFLIHLLQWDLATDIAKSETESALQLSEQLSGHALALAQMAGLIHRRRWSIKEFLAMYNRNTRKLHGQSLDTVWLLSFQSLDERAKAVLGVLSCIHPDEICQELFELHDVDLPLSLQFCTDEYGFSEVLEILLTSALIKRERESRILSIHRLVQTQFLFHITAEERRISLNNAAELLWEAFPSVNAKRGQLYDRWEQCQRYLQHVLSLRDKLHLEMIGPDKILPTTIKFSDLLNNAARYLLETASYEEMSKCLEIAKAAFESLPQAEQQPKLLADIENSTGLLLAHRGKFATSEGHIRKAIQIRVDHMPADVLGLSWASTNLGNVLASSGKSYEALVWAQHAVEERQRAEQESDKNLRPEGVLLQNLARVLTQLQRFDEAAAQFRVAVDIFAESENWAMLSYTYFGIGCLNRRRGDSQAAKTSFFEAREAWLAKGQRRMHHFHAACLYKLGCICGDLDDLENALVHLREAQLITNVIAAELPGHHARVLYKLAEVLDRRMTGDKEAVVLRKEASTYLEGNTLMLETLSLNESNLDFAFDSLVYILWR